MAGGSRVVCVTAPFRITPCRCKEGNLPPTLGRSLPPHGPLKTKDLSRRRVHHQWSSPSVPVRLARSLQPQLLSAAKHLVVRDRVGLPVLGPSICRRPAIGRAARTGLALRGEVARAPPRIPLFPLRSSSGPDKPLFGVVRLAFLRCAAFRSRGERGNWLPRFSFFSSSLAPRW